MVDRPYDVGKGKPPKATRFQSGQSGNARGRPKGAKNLSTLLQEQLASAVPITEKGRRRNASKGQVMMIQLTNQAAGGNLKAVALVHNMERQIADNKAIADTSFGAADLLVVESMVARVRRALAAEPEAEEPQAEPTSDEKEPAQ